MRDACVCAYERVRLKLFLLLSFFFWGGGEVVSFTELIFIIASLYISYCDVVQRQRLVLFFSEIG